MARGSDLSADIEDGALSYGIVYAQVVLAHTGAVDLDTAAHGGIHLKWTTVEPDLHPRNPNQRM